MHETAFINKITKEAEKQGNVTAVVIEIGELAGIQAEHLEEHLKEAVNWDIKIIKKDSLVICDCGFKGRPKIIEKAHDFTLFECPECKSIPKILDGDKVILKRVIVK
ncbi:hydrogenase maturation nickel metallochaperone HypA [Candidatus Woesearchaeota archaeon]|nr:hydrogenase maturation nickel metallochaperone HypA [Candidatus Woesearchaeota archaeon]